MSTLDLMMKHRNKTISTHSSQNYFRKVSKKQKKKINKWFMR